MSDVSSVETPELLFVLSVPFVSLSISISPPSVGVLTVIVFNSTSSGSVCVPIVRLDTDVTEDLLITETSSEYTVLTGDIASSLAVSASHFVSSIELGNSTTVELFTAGMLSSS